jgi:Cd2+/Zn2+-exporting ATPase
VLVFILTRDIELSLTLLVIGCPGALVISTPVSIVAGIGRAAKKGILIKGGEYLENAGKITAVALDKTGTLTEGKPRLTDIIVLQPELAGAAGSDLIAQTPGGRWDAEQLDVLRWAGITEAGSEHPLARPILAEASRYGLVPEPESFETITGKGVLASYLGNRIAVGTAALMADLEIAVPSETRQRLDSLKSAGKTAVIVSLDNTVIGVLGIADSLREDAPEMVRRLRQSGGRQSGVRKVVMLTGDDRRTAEAIAREAGITDVCAELLPEGKLDAIRGLQKEGHVVAMIGDGINDAPALAAADIGIAMGAAGTGIAIETADMALMADDLLKIPQAIGLSRSVLNNIRQNVVVALVTVTVLLAGVLLGQVHMAGGMLIHQFSVLLVIANGMRLLRA